VTVNKENEVVIDKEKIDEAYNDIEERIGGKDALEEALVLNNITADELKSQLENELILKAIVEPTLEYTEEDLKVTILDLGWRHGGRYLPQESDISSVAFWYQTEPHSKFPKLPGWKELEVN